MGSALTGRSQIALESLVGVFIQPTALRTEWSGEIGFAELVGRVRKGTQAAIAHQDYPFHSWLEQLRRERQDSDYLPYTVTVITQDPPALLPFEDLQAKFRLPSEILPSESVERSSDDAESTGVAGLEQLTGPGMSLTLGVSKTEQVNLLLATASGQFRQATLDRLLGYFHRLLDQVAADPNKPLEELVLLEEGERAELDPFMAGQAAPSQLMPSDALIAGLEEWMGADRPEALALLNAEGQTVISDAPEIFDPYELLRWLHRHEAEVVISRVESAEALISTLGRVDPRDLKLKRWISVGGAPRGAGKMAEALTFDLFYPLAEGTAAGLWAEKGPSAGTSEQMSAQPGVFFAGWPSSSFPVRVQDASGECAPVGIVGECFLKSSASQARVATGHFARWRDDGLLEVVSRPALTERPAEVPGAPAGRYVAPRNTIERRMANIWRKVLEIPQVGVDDDFFAIGGNRRLAGRSRARGGRCQPAGFSRADRRAPDGRCTRSGGGEGHGIDR